MCKRDERTRILRRRWKQVGLTDETGIARQGARIPTQLSQLFPPYIARHIPAFRVPPKNMLEHWSKYMTQSHILFLQSPSSLLLLHQLPPAQLFLPPAPVEAAAEGGGEGRGEAVGRGGSGDGQGALQEDKVLAQVG